MSDGPGLRPLHLVDALAQAVDQEVTYAYDDLVFISHSEVLVKFTDRTDDELHFFVHQQLDDAAHDALKAKYEITAQQQQTHLVYRGRFAMAPKAESEEIELQFFPVETDA